MSLPVPPHLHGLRAAVESVFLDRRFQLALFLASLVAFWLLQGGVAYAR